MTGDDEQRLSPAVSSVLGSLPGVIAHHDRVLARAGTTTALDHLVTSSAGGYLVQERAWPGSVSVQHGSLIRHRTGPAGQWARGAADHEVDAVRRTAEAVELVLGRPVDPVLVLTGAGSETVEPVQLRGVVVLGVVHLHGWLSALPEQLDRADRALLAARMDRAFRKVTDRPRIPSWQDRVVTHPPRPTTRGPVPVRAAPGPRDYVLAPPAGGPARAVPDCRPPRGNRALSIALALAVSLGLSAVAGVAARSELWRDADPPAAAPFPPEGVTAAAPPRAAPAAPVTRYVRVERCDVLTAQRLRSVLGRAVYAWPSESPSVCQYGLSMRSTDGVALRVAVGASALEGPSGRPGLRLTYPAGGVAPDGSGRVLHAPVLVEVGTALSGDPDGAQRLAQAVGHELVAAH